MASSSGRSEWLFGRFVFRTRPASDVVSAKLPSHRGPFHPTLEPSYDMLRCGIAARSRRWTDRPPFGASTIWAIE